MKCKNCGGDYSVNEAKCSFCGTPNPEGARRLEEKRRRLDFFRLLRLETLLKAGPIVTIKVLTRMIWVGVGILAAGTLILFLVYISEENIKEIAKEDLEVHKAQLRELKNQEDYHMISRYMELEGLPLYGDGLEEYAMIREMHSDLLKFRSNQEELRSMKVEELKDNPYSAKAMMKATQRIASYGHDHYLYKDDFSHNKEIYEAFMEEVRVSLMLNLKLTENEIDTLLTETEISDAYYEALCSTALERVISDAAGR